MKEKFIIFTTTPGVCGSADVKNDMETQINSWLSTNLYRIISISHCDISVNYMSVCIVYKENG